jgi:hypothetical protein
MIGFIGTSLQLQSIVTAHTFNSWILLRMKQILYDEPLTVLNDAYLTNKFLKSEFEFRHDRQSVGQSVLG